MGTKDARPDAAAMLVFAEVVASGSFTAAARRLGLSKASVSREVARLERRLGAQLLRRTTRSMSLTEIGETFYAGCQRVAEEAEQAQRLVGELQAEPRGELRLSTPVSLGQFQIAPRLPAFLARHPKVRLRVELTDRKVDLIGEKIDLAVRIAGRMADAGLAQRRRRLLPNDHARRGGQLPELPARRRGNLLGAQPALQHLRGRPVLRLWTAWEDQLRQRHGHLHGLPVTVPQRCRLPEPSQLDQRLLRE